MSIASDPDTDRLVAELYRIDGKAEIVDGRIVILPLSGGSPSRAAGAILYSLTNHENDCGGRAYTSTVAYLINLPHRKSISPDASFYVGPRWGMKFPEGAPMFAVEVRGQDEYGADVERAIAAKRADYFAAGTKVVWDVDLLSDEVVRVYRADSPERPTIYHRGETAEAEPAVPGWTFPVDELID
ncbi:MAG: Uma2 family endonuclease [Planctomycetes bacterium]|nr:Uma2 family endonuclease [Planctomycetota bacterium]